MRFWSWVGIACAFLSFVISISIVIYLCCIGECFGIENISFGDTSVAILCAIVGLLVGWQIYNTIGVDKRMKGFESKFKSFVDKEISKSSSYTNASAEFIQGVIILSHNETENYALAYDLFSRSLAHYIESGVDINKHADACIFNMERSFKKKWKDEFDFTLTEQSVSISLKSGVLNREQIKKLVSLENRRKEFTDRFKIISS